MIRVYCGFNTYMCSIFIYTLYHINRWKPFFCVKIKKNVRKENHHHDIASHIHTTPKPNHKWKINRKAVLKTTKFCHLHDFKANKRQQWFSFFWATANKATIKKIIVNKKKLDKYSHVLLKAFNSNTFPLFSLENV